MAEREHWTIPLIPTSPNRLLGAPWYRAHKVRTEWKEALRYIVRKRPEPIRGLVEIRIVVYRPRLLDPDNAVGAIKPILDGLVELGHLEGDKPGQVVFEVEQKKATKREQRTEIFLRGPIVSGKDREETLINVTRDEYVRFKRAQAQNARYPGTLAAWVSQNLGDEARTEIVMRGATLCMRPLAKRIPSLSISRIVKVTAEEYARLEREQDGEAKEEAFEDQEVPGNPHESCISESRL